MRQPGHFDDSGANAHVASQMHHMSVQRMGHRTSNYQGRPEFTSEKGRQFGAASADGQGRWERERPMPNTMPSHMLNESQRSGGPRSYYEGHRSDTRMGLEKQGNIDPRPQPHEEDMDIRYDDDNLRSQTFEGLEQRFLDDITKLSKDQSDVEDAENARHRERINAINIQYQEQLAALRAQYASRRDEFLQRESHARQQTYQQAVMVQHHRSSVGSSDRQGVGAISSREPQRVYNANYDSYEERGRFLGNARDHGFEPRGQYPGGRVYDTGSRYY